MVAVAAFARGLLFGAGLLMSGIAKPAKVLNFLDRFGTWDPSLALVMAAALAVSAPGFALARQRGRAVYAGECQWPAKTAIDAPLVIGAVMFGAGWGLVGLCPGPALVNLATLSLPVIAFVAAMAVGMAAHDLWRSR